MSVITIKKNEAPSLATCEMVCDGGLHPKLNNFELTSFLNSHETNLMIGRPASGKTSLLYSFFKSPKVYRKVFHNIYLFQPSHSRASMKDNIFAKIPEEQCYEELDYDSLNSVMTAIKAEDKKYNNCVIFDDMTASLKNADVKKMLKELIFNRRHLRTTIIFLVQTWYSVEKDIRKLFSNIFCFRVSKQELSTIFDEVVESKAKYINDIAKIVFDRPYKYLFINVNSQRLFDGFDELMFKEDDQE
jgi:hypothetical protein